MTHDDFAVEEAPGLAKKLPEGERILWQGAPQTWALAKSALGVNWVIGYFGVLAIWRGIAMWFDQGLSGAIGAVVWYVLAGAAATAVIVLMSWVMARATIYTITSSRVVMRIGAALTVSLNLPLKWIVSADLATNGSSTADGTGSISLKLRGDTRFAYLVLWPHVRPWRMRSPEPTLRAIPGAARVAEILAHAASEETGAIISPVVEEEAQGSLPATAIPAE
ncbi:MAG: photosynthetic complex putative assembly protein PuhB [Pseudomonadota bacterium]